MLHKTTFLNGIGASGHSGDRSYLDKYCVVIIILFLFFAIIEVQSGTWISKAPMPTPRLGASASVVGDKIYVFGGAESGPWNGTANEMYDPSTNTWQKKAPMPTPRVFLGTAVVNGIIYVIGGGYPTATDVVEAYNPATNTWETKAKMLQPRISKAAVAVDGIIYIMGGNYNERNCQAYDPVTNTWTEKTPIPEGAGGWTDAVVYNGLVYVFGGSNHEPWAAYKTVYAYDPQTDTWTRKKDMITARFALQTCLLDGKIYVLGGAPYDTGISAALEVYDPVKDSWEALADMPQGYMASAGAAVNGKIYVIGGTANWTTGVSDAWEFNPLATENGVWISKAPMPTPRLGASASVVGDKIFVFGGAKWSPWQGTSNEVYDPLTDTWQAKAPMPTARGLLASAVVNGIIYAIGGGYPQQKDVMEAYDPATDTWTPKARMLQPRAAMAAAVVDGIIYIMGGNYNERNCQAYDPGTDTWTEKSPIPEDGGGWVQSAIAYNGLIYVFGGSSYPPWAGYKTVFAYDPATDTWTRKADMITARFALQTCLVDGKIYVLSGASEYGNTLAAMEVYDPVNDSWEQLADMPQEYAGVAGAVVNGKIYVIGGAHNWGTGTTDVWEYHPRGPAGSVEKHPEAIPGDFVLEQNYPNPFNPSTTITYKLPQAAHVSLRIYNAIGQEVAMLVDQKKVAGIHTLQFNGSNLASGVYFYRLQAGDFVQTRRLVLLR